MILKGADIKADIYYTSLVSYTSPTVLLMAIALLVFFTNFSIDNIVVNKFIKLLYKSNFSVYLIHAHPLLVPIISIVVKKYINMGFEYNSIIFVLLIIFLAVLIYTICVLIDICRIFIFSKFKIDLLYEKIKGLFTTVIKCLIKV